MIGCILLNCFALRVILYILMINDLIVVLMSQRARPILLPCLLPQLSSLPRLWRVNFSQWWRKLEQNRIKSGFFLSKINKRESKSNFKI